ncbi:MAG: Hsp33 family molecular chaperone HslO [Thiohalomonadaceae bacterium]|jgi:molecular chaperone Hsp33
MRDLLQRFLFDDTAIRGELVQLDQAWQDVLSRHDYPQAVRDRLGEMIAAAALLAATLKFKGRLVLQIQGDGPINLMVAEATAQKTVRGMAQWQGEVQTGDLQNQFGTGRLAITIDSGSGERYQGLVELTGDSLAAAIDGYLERSEQLPTRLWLAADGQTAAGLLLQKLPAVEQDSDAWTRLQALADTLTAGELLQVPSLQIIQRLFHEENVRLFTAEQVAFYCSCSRERVADVLVNLGEAEVQDILHTEGNIEVTCEFCNQRYSFDAVDATQLFIPLAPVVGETRH